MTENRGNHSEEKRRHERREAQLEIRFDYKYDIETRVEYQLLQKHKDGAPPKYYALSKNISAAGICFVSKHQLNEGDCLRLEVYVPYAAEPVLMEGEVRWSDAVSDQEMAKQTYQTGVLLTSVNGQSVAATIRYDKEYHVDWSIVLESVLGSFKDIVRKGGKHAQGRL
jgi:hypothetical protein